MSDIQSYASTFPPVYTKQGGIGGALVGSAGDIMGGLSSLIPILTGLCWLSRAIYGDSDWRVAKIRASWPRLFNESRFYRVVFALYILIGEPLAKLVKRSNTLKRLFRPLLDSLLRKAMEA